MSAVLGAALLLSSWCQEARITGFVRSEYGPLTYDGTPIGTPEAIAAASWNIPIDSVVEIPDLGRFRVADRGMLGSSGWVDVAVLDRATAYAITSVRTVCIYPPEGR
jgi:3D (Asp-Asp-Asp) domain-containing protein